MTGMVYISLALLVHSLGYLFLSAPILIMLELLFTSLRFGSYASLCLIGLILSNRWTWIHGENTFYLRDLVFLSVILAETADLFMRAFFGWGITRLRSSFRSLFIWRTSETARLKITPSKPNANKDQLKKWIAKNVSSSTPLSQIISEGKGLGFATKAILMEYQRQFSKMAVGEKKESKERRINTRFKFEASSASKFCTFPHCKELGLYSLTNCKCAHTFCLDHTKGVMGNRLEQDFTAITCGQPGQGWNCREHIPEQAFQVAQALRIIPDRFVKLYQRKSIMNACNLIECPLCHKEISMDKNEDENKNRQNIRCPSCQQRICLNCQGPSHAGKTCREYLLERKGEDEATTKRVRKATRCPGCHVRFDHDGGCNHMSHNCGVRGAKVHWCRFCGVELLKMSGGYYAKNNSGALNHFPNGLFSPGICQNA
mmetsp:Transcript_36201/g.58114  ORF Transcript_36201/g.58114 Transcript_36201/m.58114 type:complete len:429 (-) Transcript_36201:186-1472(-)